MGALPSIEDQPETEEQPPPPHSRKRAFDDAIGELSAPRSGFHRWLASTSSARVLDEWNDRFLESVETPAAFERCCRAQFGAYRPPADCAGWLAGLAVLAETLPVALSISDATIAGFPLIYVNQKFTEVTGYEKREVYGRNCRFLQVRLLNPCKVLLLPLSRLTCLRTHAPLIVASRRAPTPTPTTAHTCSSTCAEGSTRRLCCATTARMARRSRTC